MPYHNKPVLFPLMLPLFFLVLSCGNGNGNDDCKPLTCEQQGFDCGIHDDGCDGSIECGSCAPDHICEEGTCKLEDCIPVDCAELEVECDQHPDGCGDFVDCGLCDEGHYCEEGLCKPDNDEDSDSFFFGFSKALLRDPLPMQQRGFEAVETIGNTFSEHDFFTVDLMQERVRDMDEYLENPEPFLVTVELVLERFEHYANTLSENDTLIVYSHSHGINTVQGQRMGGLILDDPAEGGGLPGVLRWPQMADALLDLPAKTVIILTMSCFSGGFTDYLENNADIRSRWENREAEGRDFVVITSQNSSSLSNPRPIEGQIINPFTYAVIKAFEGEADGFRENGMTDEPDGLLTLEEIVDFIVNETRRHTNENDSDNDPDPQVTGSYNPDRVILRLQQN